MGRIIAWTMILMGSVILGFNGYKYWGEINIAVRDPKVAMEIGEDWQETKIEPSLTSVENLEGGEDTEEIIETGDEEFLNEDNVEDEETMSTKNTDEIEPEDEGSDQEGAEQKDNNKANTEQSNLVNNSKSNNSKSTSNQQKKVASKKGVKQYAKRKKKQSTLKVGSNIGQLIIPKIGAYLPVVEGTDDQSLKKGVGKYRGYGTVAPDQTGHVVLSGHRDTVFRKLGQLRIGDKLYVKYKNRIYTYQIRKTWITHAEDRTVIVPIPRPVLTVTTCYPFNYKGNAPDRYIIRADLIRINHV